MTVRLFVADVMRRQRWSMTVFGLMLVGMWWTAGWTSSEEPKTAVIAFGLSLGWAYMHGPLRVAFIPRAVWHLPISRRDIGRARWLAGTVFAVAFTTTAKLIAMLFPSVRASFTLADLLLSSTFDFAYTGVGLCLVILSTERPPHGRQWRPVMAVVKGICDFVWPIGVSVPMLLGMPLGAKALAGAVPLHWSEMTGPAAALLAAGLALTIAAYFHTPGPPRFVSQVTPGQPAPAAVSASLDSRLSGLPKLAMREYAWTLMIGTLAAIASLLLFTMAQRAGGSSFAMETVSPLVWYAVFIASLASRLPEMLGHLRVLPLSVRQLNAMLLLWPAAIWSSAWAAFAALRAIPAVRGLALPHADMFIAAVGLSAFAQALLIPLTAQARLFMLAMMAGVVPMLPFAARPGAAALTLFGLGALAAAGWVNHIMLTRGSTYHHRIGPAAPIVLR